MFEFTIDNDLLRINLVDPFGDGQSNIVYLDRFDKERWVALAYPDILVTQTTTKESTYEAVKAALDSINIVLEEMYGKGASVPENGLALVQWIISNDIEIVNNKVHIKS